MTTMRVARRIVQAKKTLLIVEDDKPLLQRLARAMASRAFDVRVATSVKEGLEEIKKSPPAYAVFDIRLGDGNGLDLISVLKKCRPEARSIVLTGYGNIATAVDAVKMGAIDYLAKPVNAADVVAALLAAPGRCARPTDHAMSAARVRWEHIQAIFESCGRHR